MGCSIVVRHAVDPVHSVTDLDIVLAQIGLETGKLGCDWSMQQFDDQLWKDWEQEVDRITEKLYIHHLPPRKSNSIDYG